MKVSGGGNPGKELEGLKIKVYALKTEGNETESPSLVVSLRKPKEEIRKPYLLLAGLNHVFFFFFCEKSA